MGEVAVAALFHQAGVIRTDTLEELFNVATVLANQPLPRGNRVAIVANGAGPGLPAADACRSHGLRVPRLGNRTTQRLQAFLAVPDLLDQPVVLSSGGPCGSWPTIPSSTRCWSSSPPPALTEPDSVARELAAARRDLDAARWRARPLGNVVEVGDADVDTARAVVDGALDRAAADSEHVLLDLGQAERLLSAFGITIARTQVVRSPQEAAETPTRLATDVVVKSAAPGRKRALGGVRLRLSRTQDVAEAVQAMRQELEAAGRHDMIEHGFLVQETVPDGVETFVRVTHDPTFGPILQLGMGGALAELLGDASAPIHPLTDVDVDEMLTSLRSYPLLTGYEAADPVDVDALKTLLFRVSALVEEIPHLDELDLNPMSCAVVAWPSSTPG